MDKRDMLIEELKRKFMPSGIAGFTYTEPVCRIDALADFILARDKKNAEPLVKYVGQCDDVVKAYFRDTSEYGPDERISSMFNAMEATLTNLGVESKEKI